MKRYRQLAAASIGALLVLPFFTNAIAKEAGDLDGEALLVTSGDPSDPLYANAGENLRTGVGSIFIEFEGVPVGGFLCTASVIDDRHVLTSAHCVREAGDTVRRIRLVLTAGLDAPMIIDATGFASNPLYDFLSPFFGAFAPGDVAIIEMPNPLPAEVERYALYRDNDEFGKETRHYGHGRSGKGNKGATGGSDFFYARTGLNMYEQTLEPFFGPGFDQLLHDFDSGGSKHNAMEWWFTSAFACHPENTDNPPQAQDGQCTTFKDGSYPDFKGFGKLEVGVAPGDSGGPGFIDGKIAGVHSFGFTHNCAGVTNGTDFSCGLNSSYGEMSGDARVSTEAAWIDGVLEGMTPVTPIPEPIPASAAAASEEAVELSVLGKAFMGAAVVGRMRTPITFDEVKEQLDLD